MDTRFSLQSKTKANFLRQRLSDQSFYYVQLHRKDEQYGLCYHCTEDDLVYVTAVQTDSAVDEWNQSSLLHDVICVGDIIVSANGLIEPREIIDELVSCDHVVLIMVKSGPRWHLHGRTAECIQKLEVALGKGLQLKLKVPPDQQDDPQHLLTLRPSHFAVILFAVMAPTAAVSFLFSDMGIASHTYTFFAPKKISMFYGNGLILCGICMAILFYIADWRLWKVWWHKVGTGVAVIYIVCAGTVLKSRKYPFFPSVIGMFHVPLLLGLLRSSVVRHVRRSHFYMAVACCTFLCFLTTLISWLFWIRVRSFDGINMWNVQTQARLAADYITLYQETLITIDNRKRSLDYSWDCVVHADSKYDYKLTANQTFVRGKRIGDSDRRARQKECARIKTCWFLAYIVPLICAGVNLVFSAFCLLNAAIVKLGYVSKYDKILKMFIFILLIAILIMWVCSSFAGGSMMLTYVIAAFTVAGIATLTVWVCMELGQQAISTIMMNSKIMSMLFAIATSNWFRAGLWVGCACFVFPCLIIDALNQRVRRSRRTTQHTGVLTQGCEELLQKLRKWNWAEILVNANWQVILYYTLFVGIARFTPIFLSWLNHHLQLVNFIAVLAMLFFIGFTMFLLPPVPGIPVYMTTGIILAARGRKLYIGYWGGIMVGLLLSWVLKLVALCAQYALGYYMGKSVKIQKQVGVHLSAIRAIEVILKTSGLNIPKVAILLGGPDWPTSVLCGILKLNLFQCIVGTAPIIFLLAPMVIAGGLLSGDPSGDSQDNGNSGLATSMQAIAFLLQLLSGVVAAYYIQDLLFKQSEVLSERRPEHQPIYDLVEQEVAYNESYNFVMKWTNLSNKMRTIIIISNLEMIGCCWAFTLMAEVLWLNFEIKDKFYDPEGLNGNPFSVMQWPAGYMANAAFFKALFEHILFVVIVNRRATKRLTERAEEQRGSKDVIPT